MPKLTRYLQKIFANNSNQVGVFGTGVDKETSKNVETLQSADYEEGWSSAIITNKNYPIWQEMDGVQYGLSYQLKYLFQNGIPEWISTETYYTNNYCSYGGYIYQSLQDDNINHNPALNDGYWTIYSSVSDDRLHALKSYLDKGELLTDAEGLADVKEYAHSTFDLSKFTVVGSPNITNDGIASGFSASDYLTGNNFTFNDLKDKSWKISLTTQYDSNVTTISDDATMLLLSSGYLSMGGGFSLVSNKSVRIYMVAGDNNGTQLEYYGWMPSGNGTITLELAFDITLGKYTATFIDVDGSVSSFPWTPSTTNKQLYSIYTSPTSTFRIGNGADGYSLLPIDLKQFSITVDGVEVFSGNKTGIDTIKPNNYTVVGTPTISADGIASGFSSSNCLYKDLVLGDNFELDIEIKTPYPYIDQEIFFNIYDSTNNISAFDFRYLNSSDSGLFGRLSNGTDYPGLIQWAVAANKNLKLKVIKNGSSITVYENGVSKGTYNGVYSLGSSNCRIFIGRYNTGAFAISTPLDLNAFKIYIDGNLVYQPCLKIPYTESKTGSKIVDSVYRDRVSDMYSQFGYAPYYTLSDTDFTLPQGELYGLYEKYSAKTIDDSMPDYANGITISSLPYTAPDDGYIDIAIEAIDGTDVLYVNNIKIGHAYSSNNTFYSMISGQYRVKKGDVITATIPPPDNNNLQWGAFFPMRGV